ncbi:hypothetical protein BASA81_003208 [Batrachochytrium salamandrivorans]|nr:hypothetical protein BASA81_003208 [Batrachochytrium salamandrivorans]
MRKSTTSNLMAPPLLGGKQYGYNSIPDPDRRSVLPTGTVTRTLDEAAQSTRERLPGRSKKAKDQFRRQQRVEKGDEWRGRLSGYCAADSLDCPKLTKHLQSASDQNLFFSSMLYTRKWRVKAYFDVLHLYSIATPTDPDASLLMQHQDSDHESVVQDRGGYYDDTEDELQQQPPRRANSAPPIPAAAAAAALPSEEELDVFLFAFGPVVFWGFPHEQAERELLKDLVPFVDGEWHDAVAAESAREEMEFVILSRRGGDNDDSHSAFGLGVINDLIELTAQHSGGTGSRSKPAAEKLAISSAIAQSCHLSIYESRLSDTISRYSHIPKKLAEEGKIDMSGDEISKEIGRLFVERNLINLEPELLDTPEFLWNDREFEPLYKNVYRYLEVEPRIEVLNKRLSIVGELLEVLKSQQEHQHANHLEFIVVVLIAMEVVLQLVWNILLKDILGWVGQPGDF